MPESINLSKVKRDKLLKKILQLKNNTNDEEVISIFNEIETELTKNKYGLVWETHSENVDIQMKTKIPVFIEETDMEILVNDNDECNFLLEGDNLHSLKLLEKTHKGKINLIYIDPPYNTENKDFIYDDKKIGIDDAYRHSMWLSFMSRRLDIAQKLLTSKGVIFISIDNNEYANLKLLCDSIFGENCFVTTIHVELSATQGMKVKAAKNGNIVKNAEYILVYTKDGHKDIAKNILYDHRPDYDSHYNKIIIDDKLVSLKEYVSNLIEPEFKKESLKSLYLKSNKFKDFIELNLDKIVADDKISGFKMEDFEVGRIYTAKNNGKEYLLINNGKKMRQLLKLSDSYGVCDDFKKSKGLRKIRGDWWKEFYLDMGNVSKEGRVAFSNGKKPLRLIEQLIYMSSQEEDIILDFFAGSGTTGHAVLEVNKKYDGNRKFILCTNNENNIAEEVTYKRLKNVIKDFYGNDDSFSTKNLKYYKTCFVDKELDGSISGKLLLHIKELIQLEYFCSIDDKRYRIILTEEKMDNIKIEELSECEKIFISSNVFITSEQEKLINAFNIELIQIPEYYFAEELREVDEL